MKWIQKLFSCMQCYEHNTTTILYIKIGMLHLPKKGLARGHSSAPSILSGGSFPPEETSHVQVTHVKPLLLTKARQPCRETEEGHTLLVYKARPTAASAKEPPKTCLFGERRPGRHYPTKETSSGAPTVLPRRWRCPLPTKTKSRA